VCRRRASTRGADADRRSAKTKDARLRFRIREAFERSRRTYGSPRIHVELADEHVGRNRVIRLMREEGLEARVRRRYRSTTNSEHDQPIAGNVLNREFEAMAPNQRWVRDTTEMLTTSGKFYLAAVVDLYARFVVGWSVSTTSSDVTRPSATRVLRSTNDSYARRESIELMAA
jgi:transposase InsO family protein